MRIYDYVDAINSDKKVTITKQSAYQNKVYEYVFGYVLTHTDYSKATIDNLLSIADTLLGLYTSYDEANCNIIATNTLINKLDPNKRAISSLSSSLRFFDKTIVSNYIASHIERLADIMQEEYDTYANKTKEYDDKIKMYESNKIALRTTAINIFTSLLKDIGFPSHKAFNTHCTNIYAITTFSIQILLDKLYGMYICNTNHHINDSSYHKDSLLNFKLQLTDRSYMILDGNTFYYYIKSSCNNYYDVYKLCSFNIMSEVILNDSKDYLDVASMLSMHRMLLADIKTAIYKGNNW